MKEGAEPAWPALRLPLFNTRDGAAEDPSFSGSLSVAAVAAPSHFHIAVSWTASQIVYNLAGSSDTNSLSRRGSITAQLLMLTCPVAYAGTRPFPRCTHTHAITFESPPPGTPGATLHYAPLLAQSAVSHGVAHKRYQTLPACRLGICLNQRIQTAYLHATAFC